MRRGGRGGKDEDGSVQSFLLFFPPSFPALVGHKRARHELVILPAPYPLLYDHRRHAMVVVMGEKGQARKGIHREFARNNIAYIIIGTTKEMSIREVPILKLYPSVNFYLRK